jgi:RNA polymerase sigma factor (sigma-70 family)
LAKSILTEFFEENYHHFKYYLKKRFNELNEYDVEDIIQQTVMKLLYKGDDVMSISNLSSYMYTSLQNGAKDYFKKNNRVILQAEQTEGSTVCVEDQVLLLELKQLIREAINSLDAKSRYVFVETEIKGRSYDELVAETGEKLGTLLSRKNRAKIKLRAALSAYIRR